MSFEERVEFDTHLDELVSIAEAPGQVVGGSGDTDFVLASELTYIRQALAHGLHAIALAVASRRS